MATFIPKKFTKEVISMRISVDLLTEIDEKAAEIGISRNEFINQCITFAMENMDDGENPPSEETNEKK